MGLAIGFGLQGLVQDVVTGLTLVFSDLYDVGDMVEISGQTGIVRKVGMRFTVLENPLGAEVFIPNRLITNVVNYPRGYVRSLVDVTLSNDAEIADIMQEKVAALVSSAMEQFPGIVIAPPSVEGTLTTSAGKKVLRVKFRIWPGRGAPIEIALKQELIQTLKDIDPSYADWMVTVNYEVEKKTTTLPSRVVKGKRNKK
jgi:small conductance mechanosensitive channel